MNRLLITAVAAFCSASWAWAAPVSIDFAVTSRPDGPTYIEDGFTFQEITNDPFTVDNGLLKFKDSFNDIRVTYVGGAFSIEQFTFAQDGGAFTTFSSPGLPDVRFNSSTSGPNPNLPRPWTDNGGQEPETFFITPDFPVAWRGAAILEFTISSDRVPSFGNGTIGGGANGFVFNNAPAPIPEPASLLMLVASGLGAAAYGRWRRART